MLSDGILGQGEINLIEPYENTYCPSCRCSEGEYHHSAPVRFEPVYDPYRVPCAEEICPFCFGRLASCGCRSEKMGFLGLFLDCPANVSEAAFLKSRAEKWGSEAAFLDARESSWHVLLLEKGRIPWIFYPTLCVRCARCGCIRPDPYPLTSGEWEKFVDPNHRDQVLCWSCFDEIGIYIESHGDPDKERDFRPRPLLMNPDGSLDPRELWPNKRRDALLKRDEWMALSTLEHSHIPPSRKRRDLLLKIYKSAVGDPPPPPVEIRGGRRAK